MSSVPAFAQLVSHAAALIRRHCHLNVTRVEARKKFRPTCSAREQMKFRGIDVIECLGTFIFLHVQKPAGTPDFGMARRDHQISVCNF
jgi:hypothetical protein